MTRLVSTFDFGSSERLPTFTGTELFHIFDVFDQDVIAEIIGKKNRPAAIMSDHVLFADPKHVCDIEFYGLPLWSMKECRRWSDKDFPRSELVTDFAFNFMINKKQCSRYILIKLVEIGAYQHFQYTWSGIGRSFDMTKIIEELDSLERKNPIASSDFRSKILAPISIPARYIDRNFKFNPDDTKDLETRYGYPDYGDNKWTWDNFLHDVFGRSCVSLISETGYYDKMATFTEKTLYAFFGLTFPIWVGNYAQANAVEKIGFDVFHDVINHDYQWYPTLIERCYWAFELNKKILHHFAFAREQRESHHDRLLANRRLILEGGLEKHCDRFISAMPSRYQLLAKLMQARFMQDRTDTPV